MKRLINTGRWLLGYEGIPALARPTFRYEFLSTLLASVGGGMVIVEFTQQFARNTLQAPVQWDWIYAVLIAQVAAGNFISVFLAKILNRGPRVPYIVACRILIALVLAALAILPAGPGSVIPFVCLLALPALLAAVVINVQSSIWHTNYPERSRGEIFGRLALVRLAATAAAAGGAAAVMDRWPGGHHLLYAIEAAFMLASAYFHSRIRVRGEPMLLRQTHRQNLALLSGFRLLRQDRLYARYMLWQMLSGGSLLLVAPVLFPAMKAAFGVNYTQGTMSLVLVPFAVELASSPLAGRLFDRMNIMHYRAINAGLWAVSRAMVLAALFFHCWPLILAGFAVQGLASATGGIVWYIGHTRFAPPQHSQLYMSLHMTLQGIRGLTLPFLGIWLYSLPAVGLWVMVAGVVVQAFAAAEFFISPPPPIQPSLLDDEPGPSQSQPPNL